MHCSILGSGKIGIDFYIKCKKSKIFDSISIYNINNKSEGAKFCKRKGFNYFNTGFDGLVKNLRKNHIIVDASSAETSLKNYNKLSKFIKNRYYFNLTPSEIGDIVFPYKELQDIPQYLNFITCGAQSSLPIVYEMKKIFKKKIRYVELVSSISSLSAGKATRNNIDNYIYATKNALKKLCKVHASKSILILNPSNPPVCLRTSLFFELNKNSYSIEKFKINKALKNINLFMKSYIPGYKCKLLSIINNKIIRISIKVEGSGDYLPKYAGNLDIITSSAIQIAKKIYEKNLNN